MKKTRALFLGVFTLLSAAGCFSLTEEERDAFITGAEIGWDLGKTLAEESAKRRSK